MITAQELGRMFLVLFCIAGFGVFLGMLRTGYEIVFNGL